jgi:hypothetical protein
MSDEKVLELDLRGQEVGILLASHLSGEVLRRKLELVALGSVLLQLSGLLVQELQGVLLVHLLAALGRDAVLAPLPQLRARDLSSRGVLHQVVDRHAADATQPALHVSETDVEVFADTLLGDCAGELGVQEVLGGDLDFLAADVELVGSRHVLVEDLGGDAGEDGVGDPSAVVAGLDFAQLVGADRVHCLLVGFLVVLDGDLGCHAAHGVHTAAVARLDQELDVGVHKGHGHGDGAAVGENEVGVVAEALDDGEDVVPTTAVEAGGVVAEFVDDLGNG